MTKLWKVGICVLLAIFLLPACEEEQEPVEGAVESLSVADYYPLEVGQEWVYTATVADPDKQLEIGEVVKRVQVESVEEGVYTLKVNYHVYYTSEKQRLTYRSMSLIQLNDDGSEVVLLNLNTAVGKNWAVGSEGMVCQITATDYTVTIDEKTFNDCLVAETTNIPGQSGLVYRAVYAKGVGLVEEEWLNAQGEVISGAVLCVNK